MSLPGWYPDPAGRAGHYRLWDGQRWGLSSTADPPGAPPPPPPPRRGRAGRWVLAGLALLVVVAVVAALVRSPGGTPGATATPAPSASAPVGGSGPTSAAPSETPTEEPGPSETAEPSQDASTVCPVGNPFARQDHARDGRVHGGGLSIPRQAGWEDPGPQASTFTWAYDLGETDIQLAQTRYASYAVGAVSVADGFEDPRTAAELAMRCTVASALYSNVSSRTDLVSERTTVDGYRAWTIRSEIRAYDARTSYEGDTVQITVVDLDSPEALAFFWGSAPIGDATFTHHLDRVAEDLQVG